MKKQKASADDFASLLGSDSSTLVEPPKTESKKTQPKQKPKTQAKKTTAPKTEQPKRGRGRPPKKGNTAQTTLYYPEHYKKPLKEQALHEDCNVNDLILEGIDLMFAKRGIDPNKRNK